ncbi:MAG TPA: DUF2892 domain-containing protein [Candidatus Competibacter sp.]|nr:DUF2892 domain-containing protein [Candidatus Competibacteraceae bacterium]HRE54352.1 DUF2892 domain-containing protein [Candidatus Competibacter sp.]HUM94484.1 DUF2892 domain-containing protein [Candidatus Competibacter sp.]
MQINVGSPDRIVRIVVGAALILMALTGAIGAWGWIGVVPLLTGIFRFCPAYSLLGMNTCKLNPPSQGGSIG